MWIEKLVAGVLQVDTPIGPRYLRPDFTQRAYLMWTFRNFPSLPQQVLSAREQRLIDRLYREHGFVSIAAVGAPDTPVIGRIERRLPAQPEILPRRMPVSASTSAMPERGSQAASA